MVIDIELIVLKTQQRNELLRLFCMQRLLSCCLAFGTTHEELLEHIDSPQQMWLILAAVIVGAIVVSYVASYVLNHVIRKVGTEVDARMVDGKIIRAVSGDHGVSLVYKEIYLQKVYFQHGITLENVAQPVIVDLGVNIGLFSRYCAETFPTAKIFGAEPVKPLASIASKNTAQHAERVKIANVGIGKNEADLTIEYNPSFSAGSSLHIKNILDHASKDTIGWIRALIMDGVNSGMFSSVFLPFCSLLAIPYLRVLVVMLSLPILLVLAAWLSGSNLSKINLTCRIVSLDKMLADLGAPKSGPIHLLKIDVEGAELEVLEGMSDEVWARVQQIVVEIHNIDGRVERIRKMLASKGFNKVLTEEEDWEVHRLLDMTSLFAMRR